MPEKRRKQHKCRQPAKRPSTKQVLVDPINEKAPHEPAQSSDDTDSASPKITSHSLSMKGTVYLDYIMMGEKRFEGRVNGPVCRKMEVGDELRLFEGQAGWGIVCRITSKSVYPDFGDMLKDKGVLNMLPQLKDRAGALSKEGLLEEGVKVYRAFPGAQRVKQLGAMAIGVEFLRKIFDQETGPSLDENALDPGRMVGGREVAFRTCHDELR